MTFDQFLTRYLGDFGRYQLLISCLVCLPSFLTFLHTASWTFLGAAIPFRCLLPGENKTQDFRYSSNPAYEKWLLGTVENGTIQSQANTINSCRRIKGFDGNATTFDVLKRNVTLERCIDGFKWDLDSEIPNTAIRRLCEFRILDDEMNITFIPDVSHTITYDFQWEFVCDRHWLKAFMQSVYYIGQSTGSIVFGILGDKIGRKPTLLIGVLLEFVCGTLMAFVPWWPLFAFLRFCLGFADPAMFCSAVVITVEMVGPKYRILASALVFLYFCFGEIVLGITAYLIRDYQQLQFALSVPAAIFLVYWFIIPESPRWLIAKNKIDEAEMVLRKFAKLNRKQLPDNWHKIICDVNTGESAADPNTTPKSAGILDLFRHSKTCSRTLIMFVCWTSICVSYYGLATNPNFLGGDRYLAFIVGAVLDITAIIFVLFILNRWGRRWIVFFGFFATGLLLFLTLAIPSAMQYVRMALVIIGKMILTCVFVILYVYTPELFPTVIRSTGVGCCSMVSRVGGIVASYLSLWLADLYPEIVVSIFGLSCLVATCLVLHLPETAGYPQLETLEQAEEFGKDQKLFGCNFCQQSEQSVVMRFVEKCTLLFKK